MSYALAINLESGYIFMSTFRERFLYLQAEKDVSMQEIADNIGMTRSNLSRYVSGKIKLTEKLQKKLAGYFDVDIAYLIGESDIRRQNNKIHKVYLEILEDFNPADLDPKEFKEVLEIYQKFRNRNK